MIKLFIFVYSFLYLFILHGQNSKSTLVAHFDFNHNTKKEKTIVSDNSGNDNHGNIIGNVFYTEDRFGINCGALWFDGATHVEVPNSKSLSSPKNQITIAVWINISAGADLFKQWITVCSKGNQSEESYSSPHYRMQATAQTVSINTSFTRNVIPALKYDTWYHYAYTYDGSTFKAFLNGNKFFEEQVSISFESNSYPLDIGRDVPGFSEYFLGALDDFKIYKEALSDNDIRLMYQELQDKTILDYCRNISSSTNSVASAIASDNSNLSQDTSLRNTPKFSFDIPDVIDGENITYQNSITVTGEQISMYFYDNEKEDGDIVSININGLWVKEDLELKLKESLPPKSASIRLKLNKGDNNYLISKAINIGKIGLNTMTIEINDGKSTQFVTINSDIGKSGGIRIISK